MKPPPLPASHDYGRSLQPFSIPIKGGKALCLQKYSGGSHPLLHEMEQGVEGDEASWQFAKPSKLHLGKALTGFVDAPRAPGRASPELGPKCYYQCF